jgi:hypothetical protein
MIQTAWALASVEALKLRRTAALWLPVAAPVLALILEIIDLFDRNYRPRGDAITVWRSLLGGGWALWLILFVPLLIAFEAASLFNLEHNGKQWKQLFAFPIPRWGVYATKMLFCGLLVGASFLIITLGSTGVVLIYSGFKELHLGSAIPWAEIFITAGKAYAASWLMIAIQSWLSARFAGIALPVGGAFAGLVLGLVLPSPLRFAGFLSWYPWMAPLLTLPTMNPSDLHNAVLPALFGSLGGLALGALASWDLARRCEGC